MVGVFKAYDIRGLFPQEVTPKLAYKIGRAFVVWAKAKQVVVGRDCRVGSPILYRCLVRGITDQGANVLDIGLCSTPMLYYASFKHPAIMITASHNPAEYNGFKMCEKGAVAIGQTTGLNEIEKIVKGKFPQAKKKGTVKGWYLLPEYVKHVKKFAGKLKKLKVVVDAGNGMASVALPSIMLDTPIEIIPLYFDMDGNFPNHEPNPHLPEATRALSREVKKNKADLGIAYDADCDRVFFVDEKGNRVPSDLVHILLAKHFLKQKKASIIATVNLTKRVEEVLQPLGAKVVRTPVGHSIIKEWMREKKAVFGGEMSGHYYFKDNQYADSADIAVMIMLTTLSSTGKKISDLVKPLQTYAKSEELNLKYDKPQQALAKLRKHYQHKTTQVSTMDGLTLRFKSWWFNVRASHTQSFVRINIEAANEKELKKRTKEVFEVLGRKAP